MSFSFHAKIDNLFRAVAVAAVVALAACQPENVREEKALRRQLMREMRNHSYESALPVARHLIQLQPQDSRVWRRLVEAQIGLHDLDGAKQTLADWRNSVQPPPSRTDEYEGDIAREEHDFPRALEAWRKAAVAQPKWRRVFEKSRRWSRVSNIGTKRSSHGRARSKPKTMRQHGSIARCVSGFCGIGTMRSWICITRRNSRRTTRMFNTGRRPLNIGKFLDEIREARRQAGGVARRHRFAGRPRVVDVAQRRSRNSRSMMPRRP